MQVNTVNTLTLPAALRTGVEPLIYTCPMHLEVKENAPGKCPQCGMKLEPKS